MEHITTNKEPAFKSTMMWLHEGPAGGHARQHRPTRIATGWVLSASIDGEAKTDDNDFEEDESDGRSEEQLEATRTSNDADGDPTSMQQEADGEPVKCGAPWKRGSHLPSFAQAQGCEASIDGVVHT